MRAPSLTVTELERLLSATGARLAAWFNAGFWSAEIQLTGWIRDSRGSGPARAQLVRFAGTGSTLAEALMEAVEKHACYLGLKTKLDKKTNNQDKIQEKP